ncbi:MAG TPA: carboxypeptidase regulatory-like domain-containing protein [Bryobacteraceae bacterium]|nr:carboxypeptidase regulatory-like domain-containing protein [Bryobacteraceae bacterium]
MKSVRASAVGRTPWSAADAPAGLGGSRGTGADQGVRPTRYLVILFAAAATMFGAVDGTVVNQTTGRPEPGADVSVFNLSQSGPELLASAKSDANGHFSINKTLEMGPHLIEVQHGGITYNTMVPPGRPSTDLRLDVYDSSKDPATAPVSQHIVFLEPTGQQLGVTETYFFNNAGKATYDDPNGTLRFFVPPAAAKDSIKVNATEPRGLPLEQAPTESKQKGTYSISFPIKPGETRIDINYTMPATDPAKFASQTYYPGAPTRLVVPSGVALQGEGVNSLGAEPQTQANLYEITAPAFEVTVQGTGSLQGAQNAGGGDGAAASTDNTDDSGATLRTILPPGFEDRRVTILAIALTALALGFVLLYRKGQAPAPVKGKSGA